MDVPNHTKADELSPLTLAFLGDGVFDLLVREHLVEQANRPVGELNRMKVALVNCSRQAEFAAMLLPALTQKELSVYKRGRNSAPKTVSKSGTTAEYHSATGLECLFGYLYVNRENERLGQLFDNIISFARD